MERLEALKRLKGLKESYYYLPKENEYQINWISKKGVVSISLGYYDSCQITTEDTIKKGRELIANKTNKEIKNMEEDIPWDISGIAELKFFRTAKPGTLYFNDDNGGIIVFSSKEMRRAIGEGFVEFIDWDEMDDEELSQWLEILENKELISTPLNVNLVFE